MGIRFQIGKHHNLAHLKAILSVVSLHGKQLESSNCRVHRRYMIFRMQNHDNLIAPPMHGVYSYKLNITHTLAIFS